MLPRIHPDRMQIAFDDHCAPASSLFYWNRAWPVRLPLPISPCVNARAHRFGGFGLSLPRQLGVSGDGPLLSTNGVRRQKPGRCLDAQLGRLGYVRGCAGDLFGRGVPGRDGDQPSEFRIWRSQLLRVDPALLVSHRSTGRFSMTACFTQAVTFASSMSAIVHTLT